MNQHSLVTREAADFLFEQINLDTFYCVEIDFGEIQFISRSFADQFHKRKIELWENNTKEIIVENTHNDVLQMFKAVSRTQDRAIRETTNYPVVQFTTRRSLKEFLYNL